MLRRPRHLSEARHRPGRVEAEYLGKIKEFHDINAALPAFKPGNKGLVLAEPVRKIGLRHACRFPPPNEQVDQGLVALRPECFAQSAPRFLAMRGLSII